LFVVIAASNFDVAIVTTVPFTFTPALAFKLD